MPNENLNLNQEARPVAPRAVIRIGVILLIIAIKVILLAAIRNA